MLGEERRGGSEVFDSGDEDEDDLEFQGTRLDRTCWEEGQTGGTWGGHRRGGEVVAGPGGRGRSPHNLAEENLEQLAVSQFSSR
jgi:hypothetical protein